MTTTANIEKKELLYSGKVKSIYVTNDDNYVITDFRDDTTAFDGEKHELLDDKGRVNNLISAHIMQLLEKGGVPTHFEGLLSDTSVLCKRLKMIPLESVIRNVAAGSLCRRLGVEAKKTLNPPLYETFLKNDELHDPLVTENHALSFGWATQEQLDEMKALTFKINEILKPLFDDAGLLLVDAKYEFGAASDGKVYLGDEISPDSCRIWDAKTHESLDKDRFRKDMGDVIPSYKKIAELIGVTL